MQHGARNRLVDQGDAFALRGQPLRFDELVQAALQRAAVGLVALAPLELRFDVGNSDATAVSRDDGFDQLDFFKWCGARHRGIFPGVDVSRHVVQERHVTTLLCRAMSLHVMHITSRTHKSPR